MNFSKEIICKGCQKLIKLRKILGDYAYFTTKKEWINSVISKHPNNYRNILKYRNKPRLNSTGEASNVVLEHNLPKEGIRYVFLLKEDEQMEDGFARGNKTGLFDIIESRIGEKKSFRKQIHFQITKSSENEIIQLLNNSDWVYGGAGAIRFNSDKTFSYSTSGFSKRGRWGMDKTSGSIYTYPTWSSNGRGMDQSWYTLISKNKLKLHDSETVYSKR